MYKRILVPVDGSDTSNRALVAALQLARDDGGRVRLLHAIDELAYLSGFEYSGQVLEAARKGVTVNTISPGFIATKMVLSVPKEVLDTKILPLIPVGRLGEPEEVARVVDFLVDPDAGYITGSVVDVNGGLNM